KLVTASGTGPSSVSTAFNSVPVKFGRFNTQLITQLSSMGPQFKGGAYVAIGDVNKDGIVDIIVSADAGWLPLVRVYHGAPANTLPTLASIFLAYDNKFRGGVRVAAGDINGDGFADIVTAPGAGRGGAVQVFDGASLRMVDSFLPFGADYKNGIYVAVGDVNGDGVRDVIASVGSNRIPFVSF